ncbi:MAG: DUF4340 domain-containing protein [Verrucomicrobiota bacterium]
MKPKQLMVLLVVALVLGGGGLWVLKQRSAGFDKSRGTMGGSVLGSFDGAKVTAIRIQQGSNTVNVVRDGDAWVVRERGNYPANLADLGSFLQKLDGLKVARPVNVGASRLPMLELTGNAVTVVDLLGADGKPIKSLRLGKQSTKGGGDDPMGGGGFPDGRYVQVGDAVSLVGDPLSSAKPSPEEWIAKEFIKVEQPVAVTITQPEATNSFSLTRTNEFGEWILVAPAAGETLDKNKLWSFSSLLGSASFTDIILNPDVAALGLDHPVTAQVKTAGGFTYDLKVGKADGENHAVQVAVSADIPKERKPGAEEKPEDKDRLDKEFKEKLAKQEQKLKSEQALGKWTFKVSKWTVEPLLKKRSELMTSPKAEGGKPDAAGGGADESPFPLPKLPGAKE